MTLAGSDYLLRLSSLAVALVGFSAVVVAVLRALDAELTDLHTYYVRLFMEGGLSVAAFSLFPPALSFTGLADSTVWRLSSVVAAAVFSVYLTFLFRRRRRVMRGRIPFQAGLTFAISITAALALWANAVGVGFRPNAGPYVLSLTWLLVDCGWVFIQSLELFFGKTRSRP